LIKHLPGKAHKVKKLLKKSHIFCIPPVVSLKTRYRCRNKGQIVVPVTSLENSAIARAKAVIKLMVPGLQSHHGKYGFSKEFHSFSKKKLHAQNTIVRQEFQTTILHKIGVRDLEDVDCFFPSK